MKKTILAILAITSLLLLHAQENAAPQAEQQEQPAVTSQKRLRELTLVELDKKNHRAREAGEIAAKFKSISAIQNVDLRITEYLRLQKRIAKLQKEIQNANSRQADLAEEIRAGLLDTKLSLQESQRLVECRQYMDEFARAQRLMALQLKKLSDNIQGLILKMPPPPAYTTRSGLKMRLVGTLPNALYISENCVPDALFDEVRSAKALQREPFISADYPNTSAVASYTQALAFCKWLSAYEFNNYVLPDLKQLQILPDFNALPDGNALYRLKGIVTGIVMDKDDPTKPNKYGNFYLNDDSGKVYVYGLLPEAGGASGQDVITAKGIKAGDLLTVVGPKTSYNGNAQMKNAFYVSHEAAE